MFLSKFSLLLIGLLGSLALCRESAPRRIQLDFIESNPVSEDVLSWDLESTRRIHYDPEGRPYLVLKAKTFKLEALEVDSKRYEVKQGKFEFRIDLYPEPLTHYLKIFYADRRVEYFPFSYQWKRDDKEVVLFWGQRQVSKSVQGFKWLSFTFGGTYFFQKLSGSGVSFELGWLPRYHLNQDLSLALNIEVMPLKKRVGGTFFAFETMANIFWNVSEVFTLGLAGGAETWLGHGGLAPALGLRIEYGGALLKDFVGGNYLGGFQLGYNAILATNLSHQLKLGVRFDF